MRGPKKEQYFQSDTNCLRRMKKKAVNMNINLGYKRHMLAISSLTSPCYFYGGPQPRLRVSRRVLFRGQRHRTGRGAATPPLKSRLLVFLSLADRQTNHGENKEMFGLLGFTSCKKKKKPNPNQPQTKTKNPPSTCSLSRVRKVSTRDSSCKAADRSSGIFH